MPAPDSAGTIRLQPLPVLTLINDLNGVTAIARVWEPGDTRRCLLCDECEADHEQATCLILTEEPVTDGGAELYSRYGTTVVPSSPDRRETLRPARVFGAD